MNDFDEYVNCPYNNTHSMPSTRLQWHLVKCPDKKRVGNNFETCPFNARHIVLKSELSNHKMKCSDRRNPDDERESQRIDMEIKRYLATEYKSNTSSSASSEWGCVSEQWLVAPNLPVGEPISYQSPKTAKNQKRNNSRRGRFSNDTNKDRSDESLSSTSTEKSPPLSSSTNNVEIHNVRDDSPPQHTYEDNSQKDKLDDNKETEKQKKIRSLTKKILQVIELEKKVQEGLQLNTDQREKLLRKFELEQELASLT